MRKSILRGCLFLLIIIPVFAFSQSRLISGNVTNEKGEPLAAVSVMEKGTTNGTVTNEKGAFVITVNGSNPILVITYAGSKAQEINVGASSNYNVSLNNNGTMSEVVITALGISRKDRSLGYATQQVKGENLTLTKEQNVIGSLAGKIAGVQVVGSSGASLGRKPKEKFILTDGEKCNLWMDIKLKLCQKMKELFHQQKDYSSLTLAAINKTNLKNFITNY